METAPQLWKRKESGRHNGLGDRLARTRTDGLPPGRSESQNERVDGGLFVPADEVGTSDWTTRKAIMDDLVANDLVTKGGNFPIYVRRYYEILLVIQNNPGFTVKKLREITEIPKTPLYRYVNKMLYDDGVISKEGKRLFPIGEPKLPPDKKKAHCMTLKFYKRLGRTVLQGLSDYLEDTELFKRGTDRKASITSKNAKEQNAQCITISCSESPFDASEIIELREEIWKYTKETLGRKCRFIFSRVEINRDLELTFGGGKLSVRSITVTKLYRMLVRGYVKRKKDGKVVFRTEIIENGTTDAIIEMVKEEGEKQSLIREIIKRREIIDSLQKQLHSQSIIIERLSTSPKYNLNNRNKVAIQQS